MPQSRKWQLTINNPAVHGLTREKLVEAINKLASVNYWCMCDETGSEGTYHTHVYLCFENPKAHTVIANAFPGAHRENVKGTSQHNRDYVLKDGEKYNKSPDGSCRYTDRSGKLHVGTNHSDTFEEYSAHIAQERADWEATSKGTPIKLDARHDYAKQVSDQIKQGRSPDQITGSLRKQGKWTVSTPTLYRYIDKGYIPDITNDDLLEKPKRKRPYHHVKAKRPPKGISIEHRPGEVNSRTTFGHWEFDSVIGKARPGDKENPFLS